MKRFLATLCALVAALLLTWLSGYTLSHANLPQPKPIGGCRIEDCSAWWLGPVMLGYLLLPAVVFAIAGYLAAGRLWTIRKTAIVFSWLVAATVGFYIYSFIR